MNNVKKLSPSELIIVFDFTIESPRNYPITKLERIIRVKYGFQTKLDSTGLVKARLTMYLSKYIDLINNLSKLINEFRETGLDTVMCIDYKIVGYNTDCLCKSDLLNYVSIGNRVFCIKKLLDKYIHIYCNRGEKYVSIKFFKQKLVSTPDPVQLTPSVFTYCSSLNELINYLVNEVKYNLEKIYEYLK